MTLPEGYPEGQWNYVQTVRLGCWVTKNDGTKKRYKHTGEVVLDTEYPYEPDPPQTWSTGEDRWPTRDTPYQGLDGYVYMKMDETFWMYVMFLPAGSESTWVPLGRWEWYWKCESSFANGEWEAPDQNDKGIGKLKETTQHPVWTEHFDPADAWEDDPAGS